MAAGGSGFLSSPSPEGLSAGEWSSKGVTGQDRVKMSSPIWREKLYFPSCKKENIQVEKVPKDEILQLLANTGEKTKDEKQTGKQNKASQHGTRTMLA